jgi:hypothetical protein
LIVPAALATPMTASTAPDSANMTVSSGSTSMSPVIATWTLCVVTPPSRRALAAAYGRR